MLASEKEIEDQVSTCLIYKVLDILGPERFDLNEHVLLKLNPPNQLQLALSCICD